MQPNTYPDGFPQKPIDAINFSYFLSDEEKTDWKQWLETSSPEQQYELVDTLHAMWQENQKSAVPNGFNNGAGQTPSPAAQTEPAATQTAQTTTPVQPSAAVSDMDDEDESDSVFPMGTTAMPSTDGRQFDDFSDPAQPADSQESSVSDKPQASSATAKKTKTDDKAAMAFGNQGYTPNPLLDDAQDATIPSLNEEYEDQKDTTKEPAKTQTASPKSNQPFFNVTKLRESATKQELEDLYSEYVRLRESNFTNTYSFYEAQGKFLDKIMAVVVNFEKVADFFDSVSEKMIEVNDKLVNQVKDYNSIKGTITSQQGDLVDQIEHLRNDVDRLFRTTREDKSDGRRQFEDIKTQLATFGADSFGSDNGLMQRYDLLSSQLHKLELKVTRGESAGMEGSVVNSRNTTNSGLNPANQRLNQQNSNNPLGSNEPPKMNISVNSK